MGIVQPSSTAFLISGRFGRLGRMHVGGPNGAVATWRSGRAARRFPAGRSFGHADGLDREVLRVSLGAVAVAQAALFGAAERAVDPEVALAVDGDVAGAHPGGHRERPVDVGAADLAGQAVDGVVGDRARAVVGVIRVGGWDAYVDLPLV